MDNAVTHADIWGDVTFRALLDAMPDAIVMTDEDGHIVCVNAQTETLFGYPHEALIDQPVEVLIPHRFRPQHAHHRAHYTISPQVRPMGSGMELYGCCKDGTEFPVEISLSPFDTVAGRLVISAIRDVTVNKQLEAELRHRTHALEQSNADLEQFAYIASHDLQAPLRQISSYLQLLETATQGQLEEEAQEFMAYAADGANRMRDLIQDLLAYARVDTQHRSCEPTDCTLALTQALAYFSDDIAEADANISYDSLPTVMGDPSQLVQLFQNLIGNALKYSGSDPPHIQIAAKRRGVEWVFRIRDNGIGIAPEYAERIFEIFQRLHSKSEYSGTGIGLAICKKIVTRHGGRIWVESVPGHGSTFYFTLPVAPLAPGPPATAGPQRSGFPICTVPET